MIFEYLPRAYDNGPNDPEAREKMANAATMAGMAFANAFLGVCHSMAHKLGAFHHLPHGVANALMIDRGAALQRQRKSPPRWAPSRSMTIPHTLARYAEVADYLGIKGKNDEEKLENLIEAIDELKEHSRHQEDHPGLRHRREGFPRHAWTRWSSRPSTTSARAPTRAIRS